MNRKIIGYRVKRDMQYLKDDIILPPETFPDIFEPVYEEEPEEFLCHFLCKIWGEHNQETTTATLSHIAKKLIGYVPDLADRIKNHRNDL